MLISWKHRFVFIHIPKTGGTSLTLALARYARPRDRLVYEGRATPIVRSGLSYFFGGEKFIENITGYHAHTRMSELEKSVPKETLDAMLTAAFVRNPFTRTYSLYRHIRRNEGHPQHRRIKSLSFHETLRLMRAEQWARQVEYLRYEGEAASAVKFIGYFEALEAETARLCDDIGLPAPRALKKLNADPRPMDDIAALYGEELEPFTDYHRPDFDQLGYSIDPARAMEAPSEPAPIKRRGAA